jgi:hypothetical protein
VNSRPPSNGKVIVRSPLSGSQAAGALYCLSPITRVRGLAANETPNPARCPPNGTPPLTFSP